MGPVEKQNPGAPEESCLPGGAAGAPPMGPWAARAPAGPVPGSPGRPCSPACPSWSEVLYVRCSVHGTCRSGDAGPGDRGGGGSQHRSWPSLPPPQVGQLGALRQQAVSRLGLPLCMHPASPSVSRPAAEVLPHWQPRVTGNS